MVDTPVLGTGALRVRVRVPPSVLNGTLPTEDRLALLKGTLAYGSNYLISLNDPRYSVTDPALWCTHIRW